MGDAATSVSRQLVYAAVSSSWRQEKEDLEPKELGLDGWWMLWDQKPAPQGGVVRPRWTHHLLIQGKSVTLGDGTRDSLRVYGGCVFLCWGLVVRVNDTLLRYGRSDSSSFLVYRLRKQNDVTASLTNKKDQQATAQELW